MFISELLFALLIAFILAMIFGIGLRGYGWGIGFFLFFIVLFLVTWAGGIWITPIGPLWWGVPWLSFLFVGLLIALIMSALIPNRRRPVKGEPPGEEVTRGDVLVAMDVFFWILIIALVVALVVGYAVR
jgi:hypothetical protein